MADLSGKVTTVLLHSRLASCSGLVLLVCDKVIPGTRLSGCPIAVLCMDSAYISLSIVGRKDFVDTNRVALFVVCR